MSAMASQINCLTIVYSSVYSGADQRKHQSSASLAFVRGIHRSPVNSPNTGPITRNIVAFDDVKLGVTLGKEWNSSLAKGECQSINPTKQNTYIAIRCRKSSSLTFYIRGIPLLQLLMHPVLPIIKWAPPTPRAAWWAMTTDRFDTNEPRNVSKELKRNFLYKTNWCSHTCYVTQYINIEFG